MSVEKSEDMEALGKLAGGPILSTEDTKMWEKFVMYLISNTIIS